MNKFYNFIHQKKLLKRYLCLAICLFISALLFNLFLSPSHLVVGGTNGIAIILKYLFNFDPALIILLISLVLLILSFIFLGFETTSGVLIATIIYPLFVRITSNVSGYIRINTDDLLVISIFIGVISGITNGLMFKSGFSNGGLNIISQILFKYYKLPISKTTFFINAIVVIIGSTFFGISKVMYTLVIIYISSLVINRVLLGLSKNKVVYIITKKRDDIKDYISDKLNQKIIDFEIEGQEKLMMVIVPKNLYQILKKAVLTMDNRAFLVVCDSYKVNK